MIAQKLLMLKQGVDTVNAELEIEHVHYHNFILTSSDLMQPCSQGFFSL